MTDRLLTDADLSDRYGKSTWFVQNECKAGHWPYLRVGKSYRFTPEHVATIDALLEVKPSTTPTDTPNRWGRKGRAS